MVTKQISAEVDQSKEQSIYQGVGEGGSVSIDRTGLRCVFQPDLKLSYLNPPCCRHFDKTIEELKGKSFLIFVLEEARPVFRQKLSRLNREYPVLIYECNTKDVSNVNTWYQWITRAIFSKKGQLMEYQSLGRDITKHRRSEIDLLEAKKRYQAVVEDQTELVCRYLPDGTLLFANQAYCKYHNKKLSGLIGKSIFSNIHPDHRETLRAFISTASPDFPTSTQAQCLSRNNSTRLWVEWRRHAFFDDSDNLREIQSVGRDITELKIAETALKSSEKAMREKNMELERKNVALAEVLEQIEQQKQQIKDDVITNIDDLFIPILEQLMSKGSKLDVKYLNLIKRSLEDLTASFGRKITHKSLKLSPKETQICNMIRRGLTSKEIANLLNISLNTVGRHRHSIRKKAELIEKKENLYNYLQSL
jgi:PAS domain S-box-containing protein